MCMQSYSGNNNHNHDDAADNGNDDDADGILTSNLVDGNWDNLG